MENFPMNEKIKIFLEPKSKKVKARLFVTRDDGITVYDSVQNHTTSSVAALVSGVWQASEALVGLVQQSSNELDFRLAFDTSSQGIYLFPLNLVKKKYFLGAIYKDCLNPGQLKRQISLIKDELELMFQSSKFSEPKLSSVKETKEEYLFKDISDAEMDSLFSLGGI